MKHLKVLFALSLTVVGLSLIVFAVHEFTEPQIQAMKDAKADEVRQCSKGTLYYHYWK